MIPMINLAIQFFLSDVMIGMRMINEAKKLSFIYSDYENNCIPIESFISVHICFRPLYPVTLPV